MELLTAKSNEKIKLAISVRDSVKSRRELHLFFLEGARLCGDAAESGVEIVRAFLTAQAVRKYSLQAEKILSACNECYEISDEISARLSDTQNTQGIFCLCKSDKKQFGSDKTLANGKYILLENIQDPSNLGAISRTAEALGINGIIISSGCDVYNPKALRASMGSMLRINIITCENPVEILTNANKSGMLTLASTPDANSKKINEINLSGGVICVIGNEGNGISKETMKACSELVTIPMGGRAESLNASTAAAILIWEMVRK